jgi:PAS domain S-box-containing protein
MIDQLEVQSLTNLFTNIIEDADANLLLVDAEFKVITINPGFYWILFETYGVDVRPGTAILDAMELADHTLAQTWRDRCLKAIHGSPYRVEETFELDGKKYFWEVYYKCIPHDNVLLISIFSRDITVRKAYQDRILKNEASLRSVFNTIEDGIWLINLNFELRDFNKGFYRLFQQLYGVSVSKGRCVLDLVPETEHELRSIWRERYESGLRGKPGRFVDYKKVNGEERWFESRSYPILENGRVRGLTLYSREITQVKQTENLLKAQNDELTKINAELDRFVYSASHDLRAPLMSIKGLINISRLESEKEKSAHYLNLMEERIDKLDHFISDIIHHSRNARMEVLVNEINFDALLNESIASLKYMPGAAEVESCRTLQTKIPFYSDPGRLLILFNNLIGNAVQYRDTAKHRKRLHIAIETSAHEATLIFSDNGIGISTEYQEHIFKMFFRASATSKGSGLGLYIVKSVVDKLGGSIQVHSELGLGTTFTLRLPNRLNLK